MNRRALVSGFAAGFAFSANYTNHAPMIAALQSQFRFDQAGAGLLTTGIFLTHAAMQIPGGRMADRLGPWRVMTTALAWVAVANVALALSDAYWQLLLWKLFAGIGTGACFTAGARYIIGSFEGRALHTAQGWFGASIAVGSGFVLFAVPRMLDAFGWRGAFLGCAAMAAAAWVWWIAGAPRPHTPAKPAGGMADMLARRQLWLLGLVQMNSFGLVIVAGSWITTLLKTTFHMPLKTAGLIGSTVLLMGIVSRPLGGWLLQRTPPRALIAASLALNAAACALLALAPSSAAAMVAIVALGLGCGTPYAAVFNGAAGLFPGRAGAAMGLANTIGSVMILAGAPAVGWLADFTGQFRTSFVALGAFALLSAGVALVFSEKPFADRK
jgi:nitrate/nitrite transporter NarK